LAWIVGFAILHFQLAAFSPALASGRRLPRIYGDASWTDSVFDSAVQVLWFPPAGALWTISAIWGLGFYAVVWLVSRTIPITKALKKARHEDVA